MDSVKPALYKREDYPENDKVTELIKEGKLEEALAFVNTIIKTGTEERSDEFYLRGRVHKAAGRTEEAISDLKNALAYSEDDDGDALRELAEIYIECGKGLEAVSLLNTILSYSPEGSEQWQHTQSMIERAKAVKKGYVSMELQSPLHGLTIEMPETKNDTAVVMGLSNSYCLKHLRPILAEMEGAGIRKVIIDASLFNPALKECYLMLLEGVFEVSHDFKAAYAGVTDKEMGTGRCQNGFFLNTFSSLDDAL